jgi:transposase
MKTKQSNELNFKGQDVYIGIDVHLNKWNVCVGCNGIWRKPFQQPASAEALMTFLNKNYPNATYHAAYESGICGFQPYYNLTKVGIEDCIMFNAADIRDTHKERSRKTDSVDSVKIAKNLANHDLIPVYILPKDHLDARTLLRLRAQLVKDRMISKQRVKCYLYTIGIEYPEEFRDKQDWTIAFKKWLREAAGKLPQETSGFTLNQLLDNVDQDHKKLLGIGRQIIKFIRSSEDYSKKFDILCSIPGIGKTTAATLLLEIGDFSRFSSGDKLASFIGLVPDTNSSGESDISTGITRRKSKALRAMIIEAAWRACHIDPALQQAYNEYTQRMKSTNAIIRIARKLVNRIHYCMKNNVKYEPGVVK